MQKPNAHRALVSLVLLVGLSSAACAFEPTTDDSRATQAEELRALETEEAAFLRLINEYRAQSGLPELKATPLLNQVAYDHSLDMATLRYFSHTNTAGLSPFDRMRKAGYTGGAMAENIAAGNATAQATFDQWKASSGHNVNMLGKSYRAIGIGRAYLADSPYRYYWTTVFGDVVDASYGGTTTTADGGAPEASTPDAGSTTADGGTPQTDASTPTACVGTPESEPNDFYTAPNALAARQCAALTAKDQDWYTFSVPSAGAAFDVRVETAGDARLSVWRVASGRYTRLSNASPTRVAGTSASAGTYLVAVQSPSLAPQPYAVTLAR